MEKENNQKVVTNGNHESDLKNQKPEANYPGIKAMPLIIGNETFEKLGAIGTLANLLIYLTSEFNMKTITATTIINVFNGTSNFGTIIGAYLCDTYFGRYKTLGFATSASFLGLLVIALTAAIKNLHPPHCGDKETTCIGPTAWQMAFLMAGFALMIVGAGGVRPCNLAFGADQFNPNTESGKKGINSFFNWYFFTFTFAQMVSLTLIVYVQTDISWAIGLGIPAALMLIACVLFFLGSKMYFKVKPEGSPMTSVVQVMVAAFKKRQMKLPEGSPMFNYVSPGSINSKLDHTGQFRLLDKAAIVAAEDQINPDGSASDPWKLSSVQQVEEVKCLVRVLPIWASAIIYYVAIVQQQTYTVFQALQSDRQLGKSKFQIPAASFTVFIMVGLTIFIPIYDRILVPLLEKVTKREGGITLLQRMGIGIFLSVITSIVSAIVEERRRTISLTEPTLGIIPRKGAISSLSALWLLPQLTIAGLAEAFMAVGQVEFYYKQFPENMRSMGGSLFYCGMAMSSYLSSFLVSIVHQTTAKGGSMNWLSEDLNQGRLDKFYYVVAALGSLNMVYFLTCAKWYKYKGSSDHIETIQIDRLTQSKTAQYEKAAV